MPIEGTFCMKRKGGVKYILQEDTKYNSPM